LTALDRLDVSGNNKENLDTRLKAAFILTAIIFSINSNVLFFTIAIIAIDLLEVTFHSILNAMDIIIEKYFCCALYISAPFLMIPTNLPDKNLFVSNSKEMRSQGL